jgi:hypothetical protein
MLYDKLSIDKELSADRVDGGWLGVISLQRNTDSIPVDCPDLFDINSAVFALCIDSI